MMSRKGNYRLFPVAIIAMSITTILVSCFPRLQPSSGTKHSGLHQGKDSLSILHRHWYYRNKLLIKMVHEKKWHIEIKYDNGINFTKDQKKELEKAIEEALRAWLTPVREYSKEYGGRDVVDDFEFIEKNPPHFRRYQKRKPQKPVDLEITFKNRFGMSHFKSRLTDGLGMIRIFKGLPSSADIHVPQNASGYSWNVLLHELGHAFGLLDTYPGLFAVYGWGRKSTGGSWDTSGKHAESIMSAHVSSSKRSELTYDDKTGIQDLYRYYVLGYKDKRECSSEEFKWDKDSAGCIPKYPVIFAAKYGDKWTLLRILLYDSSVNVNETDPLGNTALHEAVMRGKDNVVDILLDKSIIGSDIDVNIPNNDGETPLHFLVANGYSDTSERILNHLLRSSVDLSVKNNKGKTPYDHAKEYELIIGGEHKFPDEFLDRLNPANTEDGRNTDGKR